MNTWMLLPDSRLPITGHRSLRREPPARPPGCRVALVTALLFALPWRTAAQTNTNAAAAASMTLVQCIEYALGHSRELEQLRVGLESQELTTRIRRGRFRPVLDASADRSLDDDTTTGSTTLSQEIPGGFEANATARAVDSGVTGGDNARVALRLSKVILGGGSLRESMLEIDNSLLDELIALNKVHRYERELAYRVKQGYYALVRNYQTLRINELRLERARKNLEHAIERQRPLDIATARIEVPDNEAGVLSAKRQIATTLDNLKVLIGLPVTNALAVDTAFAFRRQPVALAADIAFCITNHEDILNEGLRKRQLDNQLPVSKSHRWPEITLSATTGRASKDGLNLDGDNETTFGLGFAWELGGATERLKTRQLGRTLVAKEIDIASLRQEKTRDVRELGRRLSENESLISLQEQKVAVAEQRAELYGDRWENGEIDILEYIRSQNDLENSRIQLINFQTEYMELLGQYEFTVGR